MSRARDLANLGDQAGSGFDASDLTTGTLGNTVQDNITRLGTVTTGTLGANVAFNDAHKDIRKEDYILLGYSISSHWSTDQNITSSSSTVWHEVYKGSGITHPYSSSNGRFQVSKAGIYLVWFCLHNNSNTNNTMNVRLVRNNANLDSSSHSSDIAGSIGGRNYITDANEITYPNGGTKIFAVPLNANDDLNLYGRGDLYGSTSNPMGQFGAIRLGDRL